jgi:tetratricopeptide (TPR) repeat protein
VFYINKAIEAGPDIAGFYMNKAMYHAELKGDLDGATSILRNAGSLADTNELKSSLTYLNILKGNYNESIEVMLRSKDSLGILWQYRFSPNYLTIALLYRAQNKDDLAREYFERSYSISSRLVQQYPDDFRMHATLGIALAGLGNKEKALAAGNRARELMPDSRDAIVAVSPVESLALIHTLLGDQNAAIIQLEELLQMPFTWTMSNSVPLYKLHYNWKSLQNNHRFKTLIQPN